MSTNLYLEENFAPVTEEVTATDLEVSGSIPDHLDGRYLRNGPNPATDPDPATYHWFTGHGMVHGLRLRDGRAEWYRNRWVRSAEVAATFGEPTRGGPVHAGMDFAPNTNVIGHAGRTFAIVEAGALPYELDDELDTIGPCDFDGTLPGGFSAHPHRDPTTGELHTVSYFWGWGNHVKYTVLDAAARVRRSVDIEVSGSPMMHDFSLTDRHVIVYDLPVSFDLGIVTGDAAGSPGSPTFPYAWNPDYPARVGVMDRDGDGTDVRWFEVEPCYVFHPMNAYEDGDTIVIDVVRHPRMFDTDRLGPNEGASTLDRWTLDLGAGKVLETRLDDRSQEFPRIDERLIGARHRYGYTSSFDMTQAGLHGSGSVVKHDLVAGTSSARSFGAAAMTGEFVFVPARAEADEDEGVLMGLVYDAATDRSSLRLLDAQTLDDVAEVKLPVRVPHGFHGNWVAT